MRKLILIPIAAISVLAIAAFMVLRRRVPLAGMGEIVDPNEEELIGQIINDALRLVEDSHTRLAKDGDHLYRRDVHSKSHGLVRATVRVLPGIDPRYAHGIFKNPPTDGYQAWIRFSSGDPAMKADTGPDTQGMAIKVMGVPGLKLLDGEEHAETQDFVMIDHPIFPVANIEEYGELMKYTAAGKTNDYFKAGLSLDPGKWPRLREGWLAQGLVKPPPSSVLNVQFYSVSAYKLGPDHNIKFSVRPCATLPVPSDVDRSDPQLLRKTMQAQLAEGPASFDFLVQLQVPGKQMPVEDLTVEWSEKDSPFVAVARIEIPQQTFDTPEQDSFGENLSFTAWHALPDHRPIGGLNRIRKVVYQQISRYRRGKNGVARAEPTQGFSLAPLGRQHPALQPLGRVPSRD